MRRMAGYLDRIDLQVQVFVLYETVDTLGQDALQITLTWTAPCVGCHHPRHRGIGAKEGSEFRGSLKLGRENGLEHGEKKMLFSAFVLVSIEREHDSLEEGVYFGETDEAT